MVKILTKDELYDLVYADDYDLFQRNMDDLKSRIKYFEFDGGHWRDNIYICKFINNMIVGILCYSICQREPTFQGHWHFISYLSVDPEYQNQGIATELLLEFKNIMKPDKGICGCSGFTQNGFDYLRSKLVEMGMQCDDKVSF